MDNEFLSTPLLTNKQRRREEVANNLSKAELIRGLELKNSKLKVEIAKIEEAINQTLAGDDLQNEKAQKRHSLVKLEENHAAMTKEVANCYKKIKMYEYEINKLEEGQSNSSLISKTKQIEMQIKEKKTMSERLKAKLHAEQKVVNENTKKLHNNSLQQEMERKLKSLSDEIKFLREKEKDQDARDEIKQGNMKKQFEFIKKLEAELVEHGMSGGELQEIKQRAIKKTQSQSVGESQVQKKEELSSSQLVEDRTQEHYRLLQNEIKILDKIQVDHERKILEVEGEKIEALNRNSDSRDRLLEIEDEIESLEREVLVLKGKVIPSNMKPLRPLRSVSSQQVQDERRKMQAKNVNPNKGGKGLSHPIKFDEVGMASEKGQRFTDRNILGKSNLASRITGFNVFIDRELQVIAGVQCVYDHKKKGGEYVRKDRDTREKQYQEESFVCGEKEFIKSISGTLNGEDKLESINVISSSNRAQRFGEPQTARKSFILEIAPDEMPVCVFGSLLNFKEPGKKEHSIIEHFGVEINREKGVKKSQPNE